MEPDTHRTGPARPLPAPTSPRLQRLGLREIMVLIAGLAFGFWLVLTSLTNRPPNPADSWDHTTILLGIVGLLGGLSLVGPPLLLAERRRGRVPWQAGKLLWFSTGMAAWLLWPPVVVRRLKGQAFTDTSSGVCFAYGTPLMALYVAAALLAGGWLGRRRRRRIGQSWREQFGLVLGLAWACTGLYILSLLYKDDLFK